VSGADNRLGRHFLRYASLLSGPRRESMEMINGCRGELRTMALPP
jgi:hypothetical protein